MKINVMKEKDGIRIQFIESGDTHYVTPVMDYGTAKDLVRTLDGFILDHEISNPAPCQHCGGQH